MKTRTIASALVTVALATAVSASPALGMAEVPTDAEGGGGPALGWIGTQTASLTRGATLVGAGDIASCTNNADSKTAALIANIPGTVFTAGDNVYPDGALTNYSNCYSPSWGAFKNRTLPAPGNHDYYNNPGAAGYFAYFGSAAGPSGRGYYAYTVGTWRIYSLDSELGAKTTAVAAEYSWLANDLTANSAKCVLAIWHRPAFSTGPHGNSVAMQKFFQLLYLRGAEIVINGHDHMYERYKLMDGTGTRRANGVREFVVGTGGASLYGYKTTSAALAVRNNRSHGVLRLTLLAGSYTWQFIPATGTFTDSGAGTCH